MDAVFNRVAHFRDCEACDDEKWDSFLAELTKTFIFCKFEAQEKRQKTNNINS